MIETIVAAAIRVPVLSGYRRSMWQGKRQYPDHFIVSAPPPARHGTIMHPMSEMLDDREMSTITGPDDQGFLTSAGRYVGREEALQIALASGQPMIDHPSRHATQLFSEDLW